jgi:hypothetical protein
MHRVKLDRAAAAVKQFVRSLPIDSGSVELELGGKVLCRVTPAELLSDEERDALFDRVKKNLQRAHKRNRDVAANVIERDVREAVKHVRERRKS